MKRVAVKLAEAGFFGFSLHVMRLLACKKRAL
jgi:hypothetical protein